MKIWKYIKFAFWGYWRIPKGDYCYCSSENDSTDDNFRIVCSCPYWDKIENLRHQESGYCHWLGFGDREINNDTSRKYLNTKTGEINNATEMPFGVGLLWDRVKECGFRGYSEKEKMYEEFMKDRK